MRNIQKKWRSRTTETFTYTVTLDVASSWEEHWLATAQSWEGNFSVYDFLYLLSFAPCDCMTYSTIYRLKDYFFKSLPVFLIAWNSVFWCLVNKDGVGEVPTWKWGCRQLLSLWGSSCRKADDKRGQCVIPDCKGGGCLVMTLARVSEETRQF